MRVIRVGFLEEWVQEVGRVGRRMGGREKGQRYLFLLFVQSSSFCGLVCVGNFWVLILCLIRGVIQINSTGDEELKREERVCGRVFVWMQRKIRREFILGVVVAQVGGELGSQWSGARVVFQLVILFFRFFFLIVFRFLSIS